MTERPEIPFVTIPIDFELNRPVHYKIFAEDYVKVRKYLDECVENKRLVLQSEADYFNPLC